VLVIFNVHIRSKFNVLRILLCSFRKKRGVFPDNFVILLPAADEDADKSQVS